MEKIELLINNIKQCNLSQADKDTLIAILKEENVDYDKFLTTFFNLFKVGKECLKLFDVDIGDLF